MKTDTQDKILSYIKNKNSVSAKEIVAAFGFHPTGIFRHLKKLVGKKLIYKTGRAPKVLYYPLMNNENGSLLKQNGTNWAISGNKNLVTDDILCQTRDVFQTRLDHLLKTLRNKLQNDNLAFLLVAVAGEIGNNAFDHNLGNWRDTPGLVFSVDLEMREIILADRGRGVFATIRQAKPSVSNDKEALNAAFTETISGRFPEQRGNGLKFVKNIIEENNLALNFYSGSATVDLRPRNFEITNTKILIPGTLAIIHF